MATTANPPPNAPIPTENQGSNDDQEARDSAIDPESYQPRKRTVSTPGEHGDTEDASASQAVRVPCPRRGDGCDGHVAPVTNQVPARLAAGPDGALWVTVDGADVQQLTARISAVCDVLIRAQPPR